MFDKKTTKGLSLIHILCEYVKNMAVLLDGSLIAYGPVEAVVDVYKRQGR